MTCPDWIGLVETRESSEGSSWDEALRHLDGCERCRPAALAADPTLLFRRLPAPAVSETDVESMRERVALLRRARELEAMESPSAGGSLGRRMARIAAAILIVGSATAIDLRLPDRAASSPERSVRPLPARLLSQPVFEEADRPHQQVVEWTHDDLAVVVLVDDGFDV